MSSTIKNVAIIGAAGALGSVILDKLIASGQFNVKVLRRSGSKSIVTAGIDIAEVDFTSLDSLKSALAGQDAVVSAVGNEGIESQILLADAAASVGVKRFIPSEFGSNVENPRTRQLVVYAPKVKVQDHIIEISKTTDMTYTFVLNNVFLDWGLQHDFVLSTSNSKPILIDGGDLLFSATTLSSIGDAVVGILSHPDETKNRAVRIHDLVTSQNQLLALAKQAAPGRVWEPVTVSLDDMVAKADERLAKGILDMQTFAPYLSRAALDPNYGGKFEQTDNELLGVKGKTEQDVIEIFKKHLS
ncbi:hypothetical protein BP6252_11983 [Coleophoma cylindrospora]|uniref:NmrA-like domain-containing protein n=1 Tax=Coleophoma cylindrospora TaxID=1849047 RepID=A0A3D8QFZ9_9HELO|nr:hypothetical protein BP6252_11983 [Coleophoma cylindrospora]